MKAVSMRAPGVVDVIDVPDPEAEVNTTDTAVVSIRRVGLCGTDLRTYRGENPIVTYPRIPGHEIGAVLEEDTRVNGEILRKGTTVTVNPYTACGRCSACRQGRTNACRFNETLGNQRDGAAMERFAVPISRLIGVDGLSVDQAAAIEPLSVGFHAAARGDIGPEDTVYVLGCGMVGLGAVAGAAARGAVVTAVDVDDAKLERAASLGAGAGVNVRRADLVEYCKEATNGDGASVVIEAIGLPQTYVQAIDIAAYAGRVVYIGYAKEDVRYQTKQFVQKELDIRGSRNASGADFEAVASAIGRGIVDVGALITHRFPLPQAADAFEFWNRNPDKVTKAVLEL